MTPESQKMIALLSYCISGKVIMPRLNGRCSSLGTVFAPPVVEDCFHVVFDRVFGNIQRIGDLFVGQTGDN